MIVLAVALSCLFILSFATRQCNTNIFYISFHTAAHLDYLQRKYPDVPTEHLHHLIMRNDAFWVRVVSDPRLLDIAQHFAPFLGDGVALFSSHYFLKKPRTGMRVLWHQVRSGRGRLR